MQITIVWQNDADAIQKLEDLPGEEYLYFHFHYYNSHKVAQPWICPKMILSFYSGFQQASKR